MSDSKVPTRVTSITSSKENEDAIMSPPTPVTNATDSDSLAASSESSSPVTPNPSNPTTTSKTSDGRDISIETDPKTNETKVLIDGKEVEAGTKDNDVHEIPVEFGNQNNDNDNSMEVEETIEECFINDARYGEYEDLKITLSDVNSEMSQHLINSQLPEHGHTGLMMACSNNHLNIIELLLTVPNINLNIQNNHGNTALHWSSLMGRKRAVEILLEHKADANILNSAGKKAFDMAYSKGYSGVCEVLAKVTDFEYNSPEVPEEAEKDRIKE